MYKFTIKETDVKWEGPGKVVGQNVAIIVTRYRGFFIIMHCSQIQLSQGFEFPNIQQERCSNIEKENDEKSLKITKNAPNYNYSDSKSKINVEKPNSQSTP